MLKGAKDCHGIHGVSFNELHVLAPDHPKRYQTFDALMLSNKLFVHLALCHSPHVQHLDTAQVEGCWKILGCMDDPVGWPEERLTQ